MSDDISILLNNWPYNPEKNIRYIIASDGRELLQIRLPMGIEQYELKGRPDGTKPFGKEFVLLEYKEKLKNAMLNNNTFELSEKDYIALRNEGIIIYHRYIILFQAGDYKRTINDTSHNLEICDFIEKYYQKKDKNDILQYRPYILRFNYVSRAMLSLKEKNTELARQQLESAIEQIDNIKIIDTPVFQFEKMRSSQHLKELLKQIKLKHPNEREILENELIKAVEIENYEHAAQLRDKLKNLDNS